MARSWTPSQEAAMRLEGRTLLVSAAAGSGKTSVLTERIIRSLTKREQPADLSRMLVVTFTRAAAAELKSRIAAALTDALAEHPEDSRLARQLFLLGSAQISTIDSFFQKAVRANFEQLGLPATFRIADDSEMAPLCDEVLSGLIEEAYRRYEGNISGTLLGRLDGNPFAEALDHLMSNRSDGRLNRTLLEFYNRFASYPEGLELLKHNADQLEQEADKPFFDSSYGAAIHSFLSAQNQAHLAFLQEIGARLAAEPDSYQRLGGLLASDTDYCRLLAEALESRDPAQARRVTNAFVTGRFSGKEKTSAVIAYQEWRDKFKKEQKQAAEYLKWSEEQIARHMLRTARFCRVMYEFFKEYEQRLLAEKTSRGILEYNDVRAMLYGLLTAPDGSPTPFAQSLAAQYDAVYIDEYQDVDFMQDRIFARIGGNRRFMVGDIKQSIYGFRGSEPSIFAGYRRAMPLYTEADEDAEGICVFMSENFRCNKPVIDFANRVCAFLFSACEDSVGYRPQDDLVCSKPSPDTLPEGHPIPVQVHVFDAPPRKGKQETEDEEEEATLGDEALWTASEISRLLRGEVLDSGAPIKPSDIAILVRTKKQGQAYTRALEGLRIPVASATSSNLLQDPLLTDLLNLLRAVDNPYRDLPLSEYLLSPLGGFSLEELTEIRDAAPEEKALYDAMETVAAQETDTPLVSKARDAVAMLERQRKNAAVQPADRFLRLLYAEDSLRSVSGHPVPLFLYEQARVYQRSSWCGLYGFLDHFSKLLDTENLSADGFRKAPDAVTVMTVHHSKGLEFPVVFLCSCGSPFNKDDLKKPLLFHRSVGCATKLYNSVTAENEDNVLRAAVGLQIDLEQTEESIRTLYVALTRARERLYVSGTLRGKWETAVSGASLIQRGNRASILKCGNPLTWILAALLEKAPQKEEYPWMLRHVPLGSVIPGIPFDAPSEDSEDATPRIQGTADPVTEHYRRIAERQAEFSYPRQYLEGLPTKAAASKLQEDLLDVLMDEENEEGALEAQIALMQSANDSFDSLLSQSSTPKATDIGTATHAFLEFCNFANLEQVGVEEECRRLVELGFLSAETASLLNRRQLEALCQSSLPRLVRSAKTVRREQKFGLLLPMSEFTKDPTRKEQLAKERLFVQGSIDMLLETEDGKLILIDYKTDRISPEEREDRERLRRRMAERHGSQLRCYAQAVEQLFGKRPDQIYIYSLPLGDVISITL